MRNKVNCHSVKFQLEMFSDFINNQKLDLLAQNFFG